MAIKDSLSYNSSFKEGSQTCYSLKISINGKACIFRIHWAHQLESQLHFSGLTRHCNWAKILQKIALKLLNLVPAIYSYSTYAVVEADILWHQKHWKASATYLFHLNIRNLCYLVSYLCHQGIQKSESMLGQYLRTRYYPRGQKQLCQDSSIYSKPSLHSHARTIPSSMLRNKV